jgi:transcription elongation factor Elf1
MSDLLVDRIISCPHCAEPMSILIDLSAGAQTYIEDCQICCQPMQIGYDTCDGQIIELRVDCSG